MKDLAQTMPPPQNDVQYIILVIVLGIVIFVLGWKFLELKYGKKKPPIPVPAPQSVVPKATENCPLHEQRLDDLDKKFTDNAEDTWEQINKLRQSMNDQAVETERAFGKMFADMMDKMEDHLGKRDERMEKQMESGFRSMEKGILAEMQITFRPMVEGAVQEALRRRRSSDG